MTFRDRFVLISFGLSLIGVLYLLGKEMRSYYWVEHYTVALTEDISAEITLDPDMELWMYTGFNKTWVLKNSQGVTSDPAMRYNLKSDLEFYRHPVNHQGEMREAIWVDDLWSGYIIYDYQTLEILYDMKDWFETRRDDPENFPVGTGNFEEDRDEPMAVFDRSGLRK